MTTAIEYCVFVMTLIGVIHILIQMVNLYFPNSWIGKLLRPPSPPPPPLPPPPQSPAGDSQWKTLMEERLKAVEDILVEERRHRENRSEMLARLRTVENILIEDRHHRANPPEMEVKGPRSRPSKGLLALMTRLNIYERSAGKVDSHLSVGAGYEPSASSGEPTGVALYRQARYPPFNPYLLSTDDIRTQSLAAEFTTAFRHTLDVYAYLPAIQPGETASSRAINPSLPSA
ncbi:hypothetical protein GLAREA_06658 [Glarea lozoyensis ATCC 20868]|uniref:Uncharacterized protein n=1 Tax=Glarea lozoyensis (strain ATCC 20868 / MF5171) TaxID=1116229 RepID=S3D780_GLAL2|nr:uncharacterized protein GLAREA_06658 [Glarea lozoyensis ATCC 20868]EPE33645.1 hypothetical protein GLAREA_06658 [Glarea lozoyensis ATCC 20868]